MKTAMIIFGSVALLGFGLFVYSGGGVPAEPICAQGVKVPLDKAADSLTESLRSAVNHYESQEEVLQRITKENVSRFIRAENIVTEGAYGNTTRCSATLAYREMDFFIKEPAVERFPPYKGTLRSGDWIKDTNRYLNSPLKSKRVTYDVKHIDSGGLYVEIVTATDLQ